MTPVFLLAPPLTLMRIPRLFLMLMGIGFSALMATAFPEYAAVTSLDRASLIIGAFRELMLGMIPVVVLHFMFGALYQVGRTIDVQSGYGLAMLIDPNSRGQTPLIGTIFAYLAGLTFFLLDGHHGLLQFFVASLETVPVGGANDFASLGQLSSYALSVSLMALGIGGAAILALFLADIVIAMLSRTIPQMNALLLGIQVKAILLFLVVPISIGASAALLVQMVSTTMRAMLRLM